jgi:hypothetical protein
MRPFRYAAVLVPLVATGSMSDTFAQANKPSAAFRVERDIQEFDLRAVPPANASTAKTDAAMVAMRRNQCPSF